jgi:alcohol dehydrogenase class IV
MKVVGVLVTETRTNPRFDLKKDGTEFITTKMMKTLRDGNNQFQELFPILAALPTTAGTGSEGGKSSVIVDPFGQKKVYGHPLLMPKFVALVPQLTMKLPPSLIAATGIDALAHLLEAWFVPDWTVLVPEEGGTPEGYLTTEDIARCDRFALEGIELVVKHLSASYSDRSLDNFEHKLKMQIAALFGAKAFRKGDLGAIHATAHALGAHYHLHHGTAIARMITPVVEFNERRAKGPLIQKFQHVNRIFNDNGYQSSSLSENLREYLQQFPLPTGLTELKVGHSDLEKLASLAATDPCQTNPIPLSPSDYTSIFNSLKE